MTAKEIVKKVFFERKYLDEESLRNDLEKLITHALYKSTKDSELLDKLEAFIKSYSSHSVVAISPDSEKPIYVFYVSHDDLRSAIDSLPKE